MTNLHDAILVVDDEEVMRDVLQSLLEPAPVGAEVAFLEVGEIDVERRAGGLGVRGLGAARTL